MKRLYETKKKLRKSYRSNPERMWELRQKFVEHAKAYIGTPYAKKHFSRDSNVIIIQIPHSLLKPETHSYLT